MMIGHTTLTINLRAVLTPTIRPNASISNQNSLLLQIYFSNCLCKTPELTLLLVVKVALVTKI